jgi:hypothetical protein
MKERVSHKVGKYHVTRTAVLNQVAPFVPIMIMPHICQYDGVIRPVAAKKSYIRSNVKCCQITEKDPLVKNLIKTNMEQINHCRLRLTKHGSFTKKINVSLFNPHQKIKDKVKQSTDKENKPS